MKLLIMLFSILAFMGVSKVDQEKENSLEQIVITNGVHEQEGYLDLRNEDLPLPGQE